MRRAKRFDRLLFPFPIFRRVTCMSDCAMGYTIVPLRPPTKRDSQFMRVSKLSIASGGLRSVVEIAHRNASTGKSQSSELRRRDNPSTGISAVGAKVEGNLAFALPKQILAALIELAKLQVHAGERRACHRRQSSCRGIELVALHRHAE